MKFCLGTGLFALLVFGKPSDGFEERIVGGEEADEGQFSYLASLRNYYLDHLCGGFIVDMYHVVTAAHCTIGIGADEVTGAVIGSKNLDTHFQSYYAVGNTFRHRNYNRTTMENDIAVLKLNRPIIFSWLVLPIPLETEPVDKKTIEAVSAGWGSIAFNKPPSDTLLFMKLETYALDLCKNINYPNKALAINDKNICALGRLSRGPCWGDSGGPLVANGKAIGVLSWTDCAGGRPEVFTRISSHVEWIKEVVGRTFKTTP